MHILQRSTRCSSDTTQGPWPLIHSLSNKPDYFDTSSCLAVYPHIQAWNGTVFKCLLLIQNSTSQYHPYSKNKAHTHLASIYLLFSHPCSSLLIHPGRLTWNLRIRGPGKGKSSEPNHHFQVPAVNLQGCSSTTLDQLMTWKYWIYGSNGWLLAVVDSSDSSFSTAPPDSRVESRMTCEGDGFCSTFAIGRS